MRYRCIRATLLRGAYCAPGAVVESEAPLSGKCFAAEPRGVPASAASAGAKARSSDVSDKSDNRDNGLGAGEKALVEALAPETLAQQAAADGKAKKRAGKNGKQG